MQYRPGMSFVPRDLFAQKAAFGKVQASPKPANGVAKSDHRYRAALLQHVLAREVRDALNNEGMLLADWLEPFEETPGLSAARMGRILRGTTQATLGDIGFWTGEFPEIAKKLAIQIASMGNPDADARK